MNENVIIFLSWYESRYVLLCTKFASPKMVWEIKNGRLITRVLLVHCEYLGTNEYFFWSIRNLKEFDFWKKGLKKILVLSVTSGLGTYKDDNIDQKWSLCIHSINLEIKTAATINVQSILHHQNTEIFQTF